MRNQGYILVFLSLFIAGISFGQEKKQIKKVKELDATWVKNQGNTGTCWSFAICSMLESDLLKKGVEVTDLSEMYIVRCAYLEKAMLYIRLHGKMNFGQGGEAHDVINIMRKYGMMPQEKFEGTKKGNAVSDHSKLEVDLRSYLDSLIKKNPGKLPETWTDGYERILNKTFGKAPETFRSKDKIYTPDSYLKDYLGINPDDYVEFTSFTHHPYYKKFFLEMPDNWSFDLYNNIPVDELITVIDSSIYKGFTVGWGGDVTEKEFTGSVATDPDTVMPLKMPRGKLKKKLAVTPKAENIYQAMRQISFDNHTTTDDHFMHITGIAKDQNGVKYYITKNSWGNKGENKGYIYLSEGYVKLKTLSIIVNKNALPQKTIMDCGIE